MRFVDANVLIYAAGNNPEEASKKDAARTLLLQEELAISVQVQQEFYVNITATRRAHALTPEEALNFLSRLSDILVVPVTEDIFRDAVAVSARYQLRYWDGAILAAARFLGCDAVYSENFSHQQDYDGLRVINPFAPPR